MIRRRAPGLSRGAPLGAVRAGSGPGPIGGRSRWGRVLVVAAAVAVVALLAATGACRGGDRPSFALDGSPRYPDDEGVATAVSLEQVTLDGERTYPLARNLRSFSTYTLKLEPVLGRQGHYVQVGLDQGKVVWLAGIAAVVAPTADHPEPSVYYTGTLVRRDGNRLIFQDGTVLRAVDDLPELPEARITVRIDPRIGKVVPPEPS